MLTAVHSMHAYQVRPRKDKRGVDLISDALPFGRVWYDTPDHAIGYAVQSSRSRDAVIRVYDAAGKLTETHEHKRDVKRVVKFYTIKLTAKSCIDRCNSTNAVSISSTHTMKRFPFSRCACPQSRLFALRNQRLGCRPALLKSGGQDAASAASASEKI